MKVLLLLLRRFLQLPHSSNSRGVAFHICCADFEECRVSRLVGSGITEHDERDGFGRLIPAREIAAYFVRSCATLNVGPQLNT